MIRRRFRPQDDQAVSHRTFRVIRLIMGVLIAGVAMLPADASGQTAAAESRADSRLQQLQERHAELRAQFTRELQQIAAYCQEQGLAEAAGQVLALIPTGESNGLQVPVLPRKVQEEIPLTLPAAERNWRTRLRHAGSGHAQDLYLLARRALSFDRAPLAFELVQEAAKYDPDHVGARRVLGFVRHGAEWLTPFELRMRRTNQVWHDRFGWLPADHVARYEAGERYFKKRWITSEQETAIRRDFSEAWEVRTDNFLVRTNHSLEKGVEIARALEDFHDLFLQVFAGFFNTPQELERLFDGAGARRSSSARPYEVHYFHTRDEYNRRLIRKIPQIAITNGLYYTNDRTSYFFHDEKANTLATVFHEATHQMFYESLMTHRPIGERAHFWIIEGIACYMESFRRDNGRLSLGDPRYIRFEAARYRYLTDGYYIPLKQFDAMGMREFQTHADIAKNYSQASGLAEFLMHYSDGRYRAALVEHLRQHYRQNPRRPQRVASIPELADVSYETLDEQYGEYLRGVQQKLEAAQSAP